MKQISVIFSAWFQQWVCLSYPDKMQSQIHTQTPIICPWSNSVVFQPFTARYLLVCTTHLQTCFKNPSPATNPRPKHPIFMQNKHSVNILGVEKERDDLSFLASWHMSISQDFSYPGSKPHRGRRNPVVMAELQTVIETKSMK